MYRRRSDSATSLCCARKKSPGAGLVSQPSISPRRSACPRRPEEVSTEHRPPGRRVIRVRAGSRRSASPPIQKGFASWTALVPRTADSLAGAGREADGRRVQRNRWQGTRSELPQGACSLLAEPGSLQVQYFCTVFLRSRLSRAAGCMQYTVFVGEKRRMGVGMV